MSISQKMKTIAKNLLRTDYETNISNLQRESLYLQTEVSRLRSLVRYLVADKITTFPMMMQTRESFNFQWGDIYEKMPDPFTLQELQDRVCMLTGFDKDWFYGKKVLDAGCGSGRFSQAMLSLGSTVTSIDQSINAIELTNKRCKSYAEHSIVLQRDLLKPLDIDENFDLVWSFGVLHHTGNTYGALTNIEKYVKNNGYLFIMLYGEPEITVSNNHGAFDYYYKIENLRRKTCVMSYKERYEYLKKIFDPKELHGYFDAISPQINDTYAFYEIQTWLHNLGYVDVKRTIDHPSHHVIARKA